MSPDEIKIKRSVLTELRSLLKQLDADAMESEVNPPAPAESVEMITPAPEQADPAAMPNPGELDPAALAQLDSKKEEEVE